MKILVREVKDNKCSYIWKQVSNVKPIRYGRYITTDNNEYGVMDILKIDRDYRNLGYVICANCGEVIKEGKVEKHYAARESEANCAKCSNLSLRPISGERKITIRPDGKAVLRSLNNPLCIARSTYRPEPLGEVDKPQSCIYYKCRRSGTSQIYRDFLSENPNPYTVLLTENAVINNGWEFFNRGTNGNEYVTKNGKLFATFDTNGILNYFTVKFRNNYYKFKYSDRYDKYMFNNGLEFRWDDMSETTINRFKREIKKLYTA